MLSSLRIGPEPLIGKLKNIILILLITIFLLMGISMGAVYYYRTDIVAAFIEKANRHINTPVDVESIEMNVWEKFPDISFELRNVQIHESTPLANDYLCQAEKIYFSFDIFQLIFKQYVLKSLTIEKASLVFAAGENGINNFNIIQNPDTSAAGGSLDFTLQNIMLREVEFTYKDFSNDFSTELYTDRLNTRFSKKEKTLRIQANGLVKNRDTRIDQVSYLSGQELFLSTGCSFHLDSDLLTFKGSEITLNDHLYLLNGNIFTGPEKRLDLEITSRKNNIQTLVSLLPEKWRNQFKEFRSRGEINFSGKINGSYAGPNNPSLSADFSCENVEFYYPGYKKTFNNVKFTGQFNNGSLHTLESSMLHIKDFSGKIEEHEIEGDLLIRDLKNLNTQLDLKGVIDLESFLQTFPVKQVRKGTGRVDFSVNLNGNIRELKQDRTATVRTSGEITLKNIYLRTVYSDLPFSGINGAFFFNNLDLGIRKMNGNIGKSDFEITGIFKNIIPYILYKDRILQIEADLVSSYLDLNELLTLDFSEPEKDISINRNYHLGISPKMDLKFNCKVKDVDLKRFHGSSIKGNLMLKDQIAVVEDVSMNTMGGNLLLSGSIVAKDPVQREFLVDGILDNIYIDSVFYVFKNFNQKFLVDKNLRGQVDATINTYFEMNDNLHFYPESLNTYIEVTIKKGQLLEFEPIQSLSKYIKNEDLSHMQFSDLDNTIRIQDRTVYIPNMDISSKEYEINVSGTHTFDQIIDYHFRLPLDQFTRDDPDMRFGEIDDSGSGTPNLFLKMTGTAMDYKLTYDTKAVKEKIKDDLKEEGKELKDLFKKKEQDDSRQLELEDDEYFDFDDN